MILINSEKIKKIIIEKELSIKAIAAAANLQATTVSQVSRFDKRCTLRTLGRLARGLGVDTNDIIKSN